MLKQVLAGYFKSEDFFSYISDIITDIEEEAGEELFEALGRLKEDNHKLFLDIDSTYTHTCYTVGEKAYLKGLMNGLKLSKDFNSVDNSLIDAV
ncbi:hypothetical protein RBH29_08650 [Herbivorax sp. ANBcel31]|uniref:hypothetical protein n=1 Tax=Herbivorax sp. ANBcel31 TaxID=3069754 RepID=UPI0027B5021D|nr:hypothetical protein [Herbivorax sp. ANBcel31]MDQ2086495.1 hypothetical protein [Herbivorax sp. ANBcel31]